MLRRTALILLHLLLLPLPACVSSGPPLTAAGFEKMIRPYEGRSERAVIDAFGYPDQERRSPEGARVLEYRDSGTVTRITSSMTGSRSWHYPGMFPATSTSTVVSREHKCAVWFEMKEQKVERVLWKGSGCVAPE